ncbi:MAG: hypothetical protein ABI333_09845 [bacterium]
MRQLLQTTLLVTAVVLSLGTSKTLFGKQLGQPRVEPIPGIVVEDKSQVWLKENVNNQGCFASQRIDFLATLKVRNTSAQPLRVAAPAIELSLNGQRKTVERATFFHQEAGQKYPTRGDTLPAGARGELVLFASSVCAKNQLKKVRTVTVKVPLSVGTLRFSFDRLTDQKIVRFR